MWWIVIIRSFIHSFIHSFIQIHPFLLSLIHSFIRSLSGSVIPSFVSIRSIHPAIFQSFTHLLVLSTRWWIQVNPKWLIWWCVNLLCTLYRRIYSTRPFARPGHVAQNKATRTSPTTDLSSQQDCFGTMWLDNAKGRFSRQEHSFLPFRDFHHLTEEKSEVYCKLEECEIISSFKPPFAFCSKFRRDW